MRKCGKAVPTVVIVWLLLSTTGCVSLGVPEGYVPDEKVVFLKERNEYGPIRYDPITVDPYTFEPYAGDIRTDKPSFLRITDFKNLLKPDFKADSVLYREVETYLYSVLKSPAFTELRAKLDAAEIVAPAPFPAACGEMTKEYSNAKQYVYPDADGAFITVLANGDYTIDFPDKSTFSYFRSGSYQRKDGSGNILFSYNASDQSVVVKVGDDLFSMRGSSKRVAAFQGVLEYASTPDPQYQFTPSGSSLKHTLFISKDGAAKEYSVVGASNIRFDFLADKKVVLVTSGDQAVSINPEYEKQQTAFDTKAHKATDVLSVYLPEGVRFANLKGSGLPYSEISPAWPEGYKTKILGPFSVLYTEKDSGLLSRLNTSRLAEIEATVRKLSGFDVVRRRTLIFPPDLESYSRLSASRPGTTLHWYPSGFQTKDYIVMWPLSIPRYDLPEGQDFFFGQELYEILAHEYLHLAVGENSGLLCPLPVWLNEGFAVYIESRISPETGAYWDLTYFVANKKRQLLSWDDAALHATGDFEISRARTQYAQSYAIVKFLIEKFGTPKVAEYVKSFRVPLENLAGTDLKTAYRKNFKMVFGVDFENALAMMDEANKTVKF